MLEELQKAIDKAVGKGSMNPSCGQQITHSFAQQLAAYTYLVR